MESILQRSYCFDQQKVVFENFEDETVLINLDTGSYYSFTGSGALLWEMLSTGSTGQEVVASLTARFPGEAGLIKTSVAEYVQLLLDENLLRVNGAEAPSQGRQPTTTDRLQQFTKPSLQKYSDMQELLLLDPIHEVDESGWPHNPDQLASEN